MKTPEAIAGEVLANTSAPSDYGPAIAEAIQADRLRNGNIVLCPRCKTIKDMEDEYPTEVVFTHLRVGEGADAEYIKLTRTWAVLVERLVVHRPTVQTYETLIFHIWEGGTYRIGYNGEPENPGGVIKVMMCKMRPLFKNLKRHSVRIDTLWGVGYSIHSDSPLAMVSGVSGNGT